MAIKVIMKFEGLTNESDSSESIGLIGKRHQFGFTESVWQASNDLALCKTNLRNRLAPARALLLPLQVKLAYATLYTATSGRGIDFQLGFNGPSANAGINTANDAMLCETRKATAAVQRKWWVHCLPDGWLQFGELRLTPAQIGLVRAYFDALNDWSWLGLIRNDLQTVKTIDETGLVTLAVNQPFAVGQFVRISRTLNEQGKKKGGNFMVESIGPLLQQFKLKDWTFGPTTGGTVFRPSYDFMDIGADEGPYVNRGGTRRVGRPFEQYRGRQSARPTT